MKLKSILAAIATTLVLAAPAMAEGQSNPDAQAAPATQQAAATPVAQQKAEIERDAAESALACFGLQEMERPGCFLAVMATTSWRGTIGSAKAENYIAALLNEFATMKARVEALEKASAADKLLPLSLPPTHGADGYDFGGGEHVITYHIEIVEPRGKAKRKSRRN